MIVANFNFRGFACGWISLRDSRKFSFSIFVGLPEGGLVQGFKKSVKKGRYFKEPNS